MIDNRFKVKVYYIVKSHIVHLAAILTFVACSVCVFDAGAQLYLNHTPAFTDNTSNVILFSIPKERFGDDFTAVVQVDTASGWRNITVNGRHLTENPITFEEVTGDKSYIVRAMINNKLVVKRLQFTYLPIMQLNGDFGYDFIPATVTMLTPGEPIDTGMTALVKWRGGYTNSEGRHKRNYSIKFVDENGEKQNRKLLGMRRDNHWKLDAGQVDLSRVRNRVATDLWLDMSTEPYYFDDAPDAIMGARGKPVEVFVGNTYMGIYHLIENIDRKQLDVKKFDEDTKQAHGMIWNTTAWTNVTAFKSLIYYNNYSESYDRFVVEYPEIEDVCPTHHEDMYNAVRFVARGTLSSFNANAHTYFDMPVIIDYAILNQLLTSIDNEVNNIFWVIYDREVDKKLTLAVWDLDWSLGTDRNSPTFRGERAMPDYDFEFSSKLLYMLQDPKCIYYKAMVQRYWELRKTWLSLESLTERVSSAVDNLVACGAVAREEARWSGDSDINGLPLDIVAEKEYIINWIKQRLAFLDRTLMHHPCDVDGDGTVTAVDVLMVTSYLMEGINYDANLDVDGDGTVTAADLAIIYRYLLGN
ncbi:MAG: CotH kinase family protein [Muribaculaceae bacterium]|nr:CotH kinase family protein [Muribaculaceae bacterium]